MKLGKIRNDRYDADNGGNFSIELHTDIFHPHALLAQNYNIPALVEDVTHEKTFLEISSFSSDQSRQKSKSVAEYGQIQIPGHETRADAQSFLNESDIYYGRFPSSSPSTAPSSVGIPNTARRGMKTTEHSRKHFSNRFFVLRCFANAASIPPRVIEPPLRSVSSHHIDPPAWYNPHRKSRTTRDRGPPTTDCGGPDPPLSGPDEANPHNIGITPSPRNYTHIFYSSALPVLRSATSQIAYRRTGRTEL